MQVTDVYKPVENVILCLSRFALGRKMFIAFVRLAFAKCFMNVASTRSMSLITCNNRGFHTRIKKTEELMKLLIQIIKILLNLLPHQSFPSLNYQPLSCKSSLHLSTLSIKTHFVKYISSILKHIKTLPEIKNLKSYLIILL